MNARRPLPRALRTTSFRVADARRRGVSRNRLDAADLVAPFHGVRTTEVPADTVARARALAPRLRDDQVFSHVTAAVLLGLPVPRRLEHEPLHVTTVGTDQAMSLRGAVGHRAAADRVAVARTKGVRLTDPATTFVALGAHLELDDLIVVGDALVGWIGWCTPEELAAAARRSRGARGMRTVRAALAEIRRGSQSPGETRTRLRLTRNGLPEPELNFDVVGDDGRWIARVDLAYPAERIAIEYESDLHRTDDRAFRKDLTRGELLKDADWWLVRVTAWDLFDGEEQFVARIRRLRAAGSSGRHGPGTVPRAGKNAQ